MCCIGGFVIRHRGLEAVAPRNRVGTLNIFSNEVEDCSYYKFKFTSATVTIRWND